MSEKTRIQSAQTAVRSTPSAIYEATKMAIRFGRNVGASAECWSFRVRSQEEFGVPKMVIFLSFSVVSQTETRSHWVVGYKKPHRTPDLRE